ncbi:MAG: hypothetical protein JWP91_3745 [Fibrobacteres bacterium]|nr:hypothetical protein [Fibrobacterota bacterium]
MAAMDVVGSGRTLVLFEGQEPEAVELLPRDSLVFIAVGEDRDGGVKDLALSGSTMITCRDAKTGKESTRSVRFLRRNVVGTTGRLNGPVRKSSRFVLRPADLEAMCPGRIFAGAVGQASVRTLNFLGGHAASPRVEFRLAEAPAAEQTPKSGMAPYSKGSVAGAAIVTPEAPKPTGFSASGAMGGSGSCPLSDSPADPSSMASSAERSSRESGPQPAAKCNDGPVPLASPQRAPAPPSAAPASRLKGRT